MGKSFLKPGLLSPIRRTLGYADFELLPEGICFAGQKYPAKGIRFLADLTWIDESGSQQMSQHIFDAMLTMIRRARQLIVIDVFLFNPLLILPGHRPRQLSRELSNALIAQKTQHPDIDIRVITDPCNTVYGALHITCFEALADAGIPVVMTDIDKLRDSNPVYTFIWRLLIRPFGIKPGGLIPNPFGEEGHVSIRSLLQLGNIKANHRKTLVTDDGDDWTGLVSTGNPHDASHPNGNVALQFRGGAVADLLETELAVLKFSEDEHHLPVACIDPPENNRTSNKSTLQVLTEQRIKEVVLQLINGSGERDQLDIMMFYLADREVIRALYRASDRGCRVRIVLDPNKHAFGSRKLGIPNRPVAHQLMRRGIAVRWADTHGEQFHTKLLIATGSDRRCTMILGSANFTRRNLDNFNLETDVCLVGTTSDEGLSEAVDMFEKVWHNREERQYTVDFSAYQVRSPLRHWLYWFMEVTGISTF